MNQEALRILVILASLVEGKFIDELGELRAIEPADDDALREELEALLVTVRRANRAMQPRVHPDTGRVLNPPYHLTPRGRDALNPPKES